MRSLDEEDVDLEAALNDNANDELQSLRKTRNGELELDAGNAGVLDLDRPAPTRPAPKTKARPVKDANDTGPIRTEASSAAETGATPPMSRAAVVQPVVVADDKKARRSRAVVQLLAAALVFVLGLYFDNSVLLGDASWFSVIAHGLALQQFGSALWGFVR
ncbi:MAG TPA: hypothetical protein VHZ95_02300 [Polyangiales bacterium]|nr:hypothetical protein [Polyangiales bacterium]